MKILSEKGQREKHLFTVQPKLECLLCARRIAKMPSRNTQWGRCSNQGRIRYYDYENPGLGRGANVKKGSPEKVLFRLRPQWWLEGSQVWMWEVDCVKNNSMCKGPGEKTWFRGKSKIWPEHWVSVDSNEGKGGGGQKRGSRNNQGEDFLPLII